MTSAQDRRESRGELIGDGVTWLARWSGRLLLVAAGLVLVGLVIGQLWSIMFPVFLGLIVATVLEPPATWMRSKGVPSLLAATSVVVVVLALLGGIVAVLAPTVASQIPQIVSGAAAGIEQLQQFLAGPPFNLGASQIGQAVQAATDRLQQSATTIAGGVITGLTSVAGGVVDAVLALVLAFLFVKDGYRFLPWIRTQFGATAGGHIEAVGLRSWIRLGGFIRSQALIGLADAVLIGIGLVVLGVPLALPLAVLTFFGAFIPIVGALVAGALSVLIALVVQGPTTALFVLILILVVQQVEGNLLQPIVQGRGLGLHAAVVILAVTAGGSLFGIAGAFLAVPVAAVGAEVLRYVNEQIDRRARSDEERPSEATPARPAAAPAPTRGRRRRPGSFRARFFGRRPPRGEEGADTDDVVPDPDAPSPDAPDPDAPDPAAPDPAAPDRDGADDAAAPTGTGTGAVGA